MKQLSQALKGEKFKVLKLHASGDLKQRLISFGIMKEAIVEVLEHTQRKSTLEIKVGKMRIALRAEEAKLIDVEEL